MFQTKVAEKIKDTHFMFSNSFPQIVPFTRFVKIWQSRRGHRWRVSYGASALHAG